MSEIGFVLSPNSLNPRLSVLASMRMHCRTRHIELKRGLELLHQFGLGGHLKKRVLDLSLGLQQRLALARSLVTDPSYLILDEPTTGLDIAGSEIVWEALRARADDGATVLVSSHMLTGVATIADQLIVLSDGNLVSDSSLESFLERWSDVVTVVMSSDNALLGHLLLSASFEPVVDVNGIRLSGDVALKVGEIARDAGIALSSLRVERTELQSAFLRVLASTHAS